MIPISLPSYNEVAQVINYITKVISNLLTAFSDRSRIVLDLNAILITIHDAANQTTAYILSDYQASTWNESLKFFLTDIQRIEQKLPKPKMSFAGLLAFAAYKRDRAEREVAKLRSQATELEKLGARYFTIFAERSMDECLHVL